MGGSMGLKQGTCKSKNSASYGSVKGATKQKTKKISRSGGWFTEKDAKNITKAVIGRFHNT